MQYGENIGDIGWIDLTVDAAEEVADFYSAVIGWRKEPVAMGDYNDFSMTSDSGGAVGVCHARGDNATMPAQWLAYIIVASVNASITACNAAGGKVLVPTRTMMGQQFAVIQDPAGAVVGIMSKEQ